VLYVGSTGNVTRRLSEHRSKAIEGFTSTYGLIRLVHLEEYPSIDEARAREHSLKRWRRPWKFKLIEEGNPEWRDLAPDLSI
jgi:putative endonuclease